MKTVIRTLALLSILVGVVGYLAGGLLSVLSCFDACTSGSLLIIPLVIGGALSPYIVMIVLSYFLFLKVARRHVNPLLYMSVMSLLPVVLVFTAIMVLINIQSLSSFNVFERVFNILIPSLIFSAILPVALFIGTFFLPKSEQPVNDVATTS